MAATSLRSTAGRVVRRARKVTGLAGRVHVGRFVMHVPADMQWAFPHGCYYERNVAEWFGRILARRGDHVVYDVGANYGYYTLLAAASARGVHSFEPVSATREVLRANVGRNRLDDVVTIHPLGLSDHAGGASVNIYSSSGNNSQYQRTSADPNVRLLRTEAIKLTTLDELCASDVPAPTIVKMDIEGAELAALRGARRTLSRHRPTLLVEFDEEGFLEAGYSGTEILAVLDDAGYTTYGLAVDVDDNRLRTRDEITDGAGVANILAFPAGEEPPA